MLLPCSRCGKVAILNVFKTGINALFSSCVLSVFKSLMAPPAHGLLGLSTSLRLRFISENAGCVVCLCHHPKSRFTKLLTMLFLLALSLFIYFCSMCGLSRSCYRQGLQEKSFQAEQNWFGPLTLVKLFWRKWKLRLINVHETSTRSARL